MLKKDGIIIEDPYNILNDNFVEMVDTHVIPNLSKNDVQMDDLPQPVTESKFICNTIDDKTLSKIIDSIKPKWSAGYDDIPMKIIKEAKLPLIKPLLHVINASLITGVYPTELKVSKVIPIYKKGDRTDPLNYRPLAIQPSLSKIFEKCVLIQLVNYFENNNLLEVDQHGYRKRSTLSALIDYIEHILENLDEGYNIVGAFLDLTKAFDSVDHKILLEKLKRYGINGKELSWIKSYLEGRRQFVNIKYTDKNYQHNVKSHTKDMYYSVPQGSAYPTAYTYIGFIPVLVLLGGYT